MSDDVTKDSNGNLLSDGDSVTLIKDLKVKGSGGVTLKRGTLVKGIRLTNNPLHIEGKVNGMAANDKAHRLVHELVTGLSPWDVIVGPVLITGPLAADGEHYEAPAAEMLARFDLA